MPFILPFNTKICDKKLPSTVHFFGRSVHDQVFMQFAHLLAIDQLAANPSITLKNTKFKLIVNLSIH